MLIDCTLRDGGFTCDWYFHSQVVEQLLKAANDSGVEFVERGYRKPIKDGEELGPHAYCSEDYIRPFKKFYGGKMLVMVDAKDADISLFGPAADSVFWGVRVATYPNELKKALGLCDWFLAQGYHVFLNPMITSALDILDWDMIDKWKYKHTIEALYIADSFGSFRMNDAREIIKKAQCLGIPLGFHAHDNIGLALANTLIAKEMGAKYLDGTACGLGRGAGNAKMEILTGLVGFNYNPIPYIRDSIGGGYILTGLLNRHPYYADALTRKGYEYKEWGSIIGGKDCPVTYDSTFIKNKE